MSTNDLRRWALGPGLVGSVALVLIVGSCAPGPVIPSGTDTESGQPLASVVASPVSTPFSGVVQLVAPEGGPVRVTILDRGATIVGARAATPQERDEYSSAFRERGVLLNLASNPRQLLLAWEGSPCDKTAVVEVDLPNLDVAPGARKGCDTIPVWRALVLELSIDTDSRSLALTIEDVPILPE